MPSVNDPQSRCLFGISRCDITPPVGIYHRMWGAATHDQSTDIHRPLFATAMVFRSVEAENSANSEQILVAVDHVLLWAKEMDALLDAVINKTGVPRETLAITFSHTHAAGLMDLERVGLPGGDLIPAYLESLAERIANTVSEARAGTQPATVTYTTARCSLAAHRDLWDERTKQYVCGFNPDGPGDDTVLIARASHDDGKPIATIVNYACHPTTLAWDNTLISPDFPGSLVELVEETAGGHCVFLQGASGDLGPREGFVGDIQEAERNGRQLGYAVLSACEAIAPPLTKYTYSGPVVSGATIGPWHHEPLSKEDIEALADWSVKRCTIDLPYRPDLPTIAQTQKELSQWRDKELAAKKSDDSATARDCRAMIERMNRRLTKLQALPEGKNFPFPVVLWRMGDAVWVAVECELYQYFQTTLRQRFPDHPLMIITLTNGSRVGYLPTAETYGKGIYQESVAVLAAGSLEKLTEEVGKEIEQMLGSACAG